jgi:drug/metabolite transporter (DMT)-like permease
MKTIKEIFQFALGAIIVIGFFLLLYLLVKSQVPEANKDLLNLVVGALIGSFATIVGYFYGSSKSSAAKDETIHTMLTKNGNTP